MTSRYDRAGTRFAEWFDRHIDAIAMTFLGFIAVLIVVVVAAAIWASVFGESECPPGSQQVWVGEDVVIVNGVPHYIPQFECWIEEEQ